MKVRVNVTAQTGIPAILYPIMMSVIIAVIVGIGYAVYKFRKKGN
jgi:hypothetical protein